VAIKMRVAAAGIVILSLVRDAVGVCPAIVATGAWQPSIVKQAVGKGKTQASVASKWEGFNRTVTVKGLCADAPFEATSWGCSQEGGEFRASVPVGGLASQVVLEFGASTCPLVAISVYKEPQADCVEKVGASETDCPDYCKHDGKCKAPNPPPAFKAYMRLEFEPCQVAGAPALAASAAVTVGVGEDTTGRDSNLLGWTKKVCPVATVAPTQIPSKISINSEAVYQQVGVGKCLAANATQAVVAVESSDACKQQCLSKTTTNEVLGLQPCTGYAYKSEVSAGNCIMYEGAVTTVAVPVEADFSCYNMSKTDSDVASSTPAPTEQEQVASQKLDIKENFGPSSTAYLQQIMPPADNLTCFKPSWWFTLQDRQGKGQWVPVKSEHWQEFWDSLPDPKPSGQRVDGASQVLDRILFDSCSAQDGWSEQKCLVAPIVESTECRSEEMTNATISGVITAILTWGVVAAWFLIYKRFTSAPDMFWARPNFLCGAVLLTMGGAGGAGYFCLQFITTMQMASDCYDYGEFMVVLLAVMLSASLAVIILVVYLARKHPAHPHPFLQDKSNKSNGKYSPLNPE